MKEIIISKVKEYYETEYQGAKRVIEASLTDVNQYTWMRSDKDRKGAIEQATDRLLGVGFFVQYLGIPYAEIQGLYDEYKGKLESIRVSAS